MMKKKKAVLLLAGTALLCACQPSQQSVTVSGTLSGMESDSLLVVSHPVTYPVEGSIRQDTVVMAQGKFTFSQKADSIPLQLSILPMPSDSRAFNMAQRIDLLLFPGDAVSVSGSMDDYRVEGSEFHTAYTQAIAGWEPLEGQLDSISSAGYRMQQDGAPIDSLRPLMEAAQDLYQQISDAKTGYIREHTDSDIALYLLSQTDLETVQEYLPLLGEAVKAGTLSPLYRTLDGLVQKAQSRLAAKQQISEGAEAPDFTLKDLQGNDLALSSLRGKYVVVDFWGSWCGWCIKGFPEMKKYYAKYKDKMEILGVDCNDPEDKWKAAVEEHALPWLHVRNGDDPDVSVLYGIEGYPTKIVVDPEGKIAKVVVGEDPAFYDYLDELFQ